jgi:hypothetical protein
MAELSFSAFGPMILSLFAAQYRFFRFSAAAIPPTPVCAALTVFSRAAERR